MHQAEVWEKFLSFLPKKSTGHVVVVAFIYTLQILAVVTNGLKWQKEILQAYLMPTSWPLSMLNCKANNILVTGTTTKIETVGTNCTYYTFPRQMCVCWISPNPKPSHGWCHTTNDTKSKTDWGFCSKICSMSLINNLVNRDQNIAKFETYETAEWVNWSDTLCSVQLLYIRNFCSRCLDESDIDPDHAMCVKHNTQPVTTASMVLDQGQNLSQQVKVEHIVVKHYTFLCDHNTCPVWKERLFLKSDFLFTSFNNGTNPFPKKCCSSTATMQQTKQSNHLLPWSALPFLQGKYYSISLLSNFCYIKRNLQRYSDENNRTTNTMTCSGDSGAVIFKFVEVFKSLFFKMSHFFLTLINKI